MPLPSLKQWDEDRKRLKVFYDHSQAKPVERKNKIKKSRQAAFKSALAERTMPSGQHQYTTTNPSDSSLDQEQCRAQANRDEASSPRPKEPHHMIQIFITTPMNPKNLCLRLNRNTTVFNLKQIIHMKLGIRPALQNLHTVKQGFKLCDALTLLDLGIEPDTNIDLTLTKGLLGGAPTLDEPFLRTLAKKLGTDWKQLAKKLRFRRSSEIAEFVSLAEGNPEEQAFQMLVSWRRKQADDSEAGEWLRSALVQTDRRDLAAIIPGYARPTAGNRDEVKRRQSTEHKEMLSDLAKVIGNDWKKLATSLGLKAAQIEEIENNDRLDLREQAYKMFLEWSKKQQSNLKEAEDELAKVLLKLGRADMVLKIPGHAHTSTGAGNGDGVHSRQSSEHQSITDTSGIDEKMLRGQAEKIGKDWKQLATSLDFKAPDIEMFESNNKDDLREQAFQMFLAWSRKHTNQKQAQDGLTKALEKLGRADMVQMMSDVPFNIEACGKTLSNLVPRHGSLLHVLQLLPTETIISTNFIGMALLMFNTNLVC